MFPLYIGYLTADISQKDEQGNTIYPRGRTMILTLGFVLGICTLFFAMGVGSGALNVFLKDHQIGLSLGGGFLLILMGLTVLGVIEIPLLNRIVLQPKVNGTMTFFKALCFGAAVSLTWAPCIGPMLSQAIVMASQTGGIQGWIYIFAYAAGLVSMFLLAGLFTGQIMAFLKKARNVTKYTKIISGLMVLGMGIYMLGQAGTYITALENRASSVTETGSVSQETDNAQPQRAIEKYNFTLAEADGTKHSLMDYDGKIIVLSFYETWCGYCNQELPHLQKISEERDDIQFLIINAPGVSGEGDIAYVEKYLRDRGYTLTVLYDTDRTLLNRFGIQGWPCTFIMKPDGEWYGYIPGYVDEQTFRGILAEMDNGMSE